MAQTELGQDLSAFEASEVTPEQYTEHIAGIIANALEATGWVEVVKIQANMVNQVHLMCRVKAEDERNVADEINYPLLLVQARHEDRIEMFLGKQFLLKEIKGEPTQVYAWIFSFASSDLKWMSEEVVGAIDHLSMRTRKEVLETPLMGSSTPTTDGKSRGARPVR